ncbi:right-handed parallel beta-helix repeat-containing protein [Microbacterium sp. P05]|uniref:right-handed parallel beta-helix repeat-containing protein n=1 Tax=Microbacterium sp. P05 TaxID=3366948 RepID=UPI0037455039
MDQEVRSPGTPVPGEDSGAHGSAGGHLTGRRTFLAAAAAAAVATPTAILGTNLAHGDRPTDGEVAPAVGADVRQFGAVGDGVADDSAAFAAALRASPLVFVPPGDYRLAKSIRITRSGTTLRLTSGTRLIADTRSPVIISEGNSAVAVLGDGAQIDLDGKSDRGVWVTGHTGATVENVIVRDLVISNHRAGIEPGAAAVGVSFASEVALMNLSVRNYGRDQDLRSTLNDEGQADSQVYGLGIFDSSRVSVVAFRAEETCVGIEIVQCTDVTVTDFALADGSDNGVYILSGSRRIALNGGSIRAFEEGVVVLSPGVDIYGVSIEACTNKAVSVRHASDLKITGCRFQMNTVAIGDDASGRVNDRLVVASCTFLDNLKRDVYLVSAQDASFTDNDFRSSTSQEREDLVRLRDAKRARFVNNTFADAERSTRFSAVLSGECEDCLVTLNTFVGGRTGIRLLAEDDVGPARTRIALNVFPGVGQDEAFTPLEQSASLRGTVFMDFGT